MSQYSELLGSFIRTGNFPLEADYIFSSEEELKTYYNDPIKKATLHKGLFRVVDDGVKQKLYWVVQKDEELIFEEFISDTDIVDLEITLDENDLPFNSFTSQIISSIYNTLSGGLIPRLNCISSKDSKVHYSLFVTIYNSSENEIGFTFTYQGVNYQVRDRDNQVIIEVISPSGVVLQVNNEQDCNMEIYRNVNYVLNNYITSLSISWKQLVQGDYNQCYNRQFIQFKVNNTIPRLTLPSKCIKVGNFVLEKNTSYLLSLEGDSNNIVYANIQELTPDMNPTIINPSASITFSSGFKAGSVYEIGSLAPQESNLNVTFNRGKATVTGQDDKYRAGQQTGVTKQCNNTEVFQETVIAGTMTYNAIVTYSQGDTLLTSEGNIATSDSNNRPIENPLPAGSVTSNTISIYGTYPYFCNGQSCSTSTIDNNLPDITYPNTKLPLQKLTDTLVGAKFASEASTNTRLLFEFPSIKTVTKVEYMNTLSGNWETLDIGEFEISTSENKVIQEQQVQYSKITTSSDLKGALQCRFTVTDA